MGTYASISLDSDVKLIGDGFKLLNDIEDSLSTYKSSSVLSKLNSDKYVRLDSFSYEALKLSKKYYKESYGYFNIAIGNITKNLYRFGDNLEFIPHPKILHSTKSTFDSLMFNVYEAKLNDDIKLDLGGMGKGYGVEKVKKLFLDSGVKKAKIALSGDIACIGSCSVYVQNPFIKDSLLFELNTTNFITSFSTSGTYNRYVKNQKNNHLINPYSKNNQNYFSSITLISTLPNSDIDAYATAASVMPFDRSIKFLDSMKLAYILITHDKEIIVSKNITEYCTLSILENVQKDKGRYIYYY